MGRSGRIVGGDATIIEAFPWIVTMQRFGGHRCGGSIITPSRILTAAHCTEGIPASGLQIRAGSTNSHGPAGQFAQVTHIIEHPLFDTFTLNNDIAVLWIPALSTAPAGVSVVGMPGQDADVPTGALAHVAGWGALCWQCDGTAVLRYVSVPTITNAQCNAQYGGGITAGMLCAGFSHGGQDACSGDSGGPLTLGGLLIGVVSFGEECARPNYPGVYARVAFFRNWIESSL